ncbi:MAG TPA: hypothetical protein P5230_00745 [Candidatus Magasanikbacteria bacterium]|nr:hypothetical protein [Candidatus Magasanikbacteria bacterium]
MLSPKAEKLIEQYLHLPFEDILNVRCPYFINSRAKQRAQLRVLIGKGLPQEIVEEAKIISIQYHHGLFNCDGKCLISELTKTETDNPPEECIKKFLVDNGLGIDCSGFVSHVLREHFQETRKIDIANKFYFVPLKNYFRYLICWLRPIENMSVKKYASDQNTKKIESVKEISPGDLLIMLETGPQKNRNHIVLVTDNDGKIIKYAHARAWSMEGKYDHGVARGEIRIINPTESLLKQEWVEFGTVNENNETYLEAKNAKIFEVRRIKF